MTDAVTRGSSPHRVLRGQCRPCLTDIASPPRNGYTGYTRPMKTAISVPDEIFKQADATAERLGWSRSQLYTRAVQEFIQRRGDDPVTAALDSLADELDFDTSPIADRHLIESGAWEW